MVTLVSVLMGVLLGSVLFAGWITYRIFKLCRLYGIDLDEYDSTDKVIILLGEKLRMKK